MKRIPLIGSLVLLGVLGGVMVATNPSRDRYKDYAAKQMNSYVKKEVCSDVEQSFLRDQCENAVDVGRNQMGNLIDDSTQRDNYFLFSIYTTEFNVPVPNIDNQKFVTIAVFNNFWTYQADKN